VKIVIGIVKISRIGFRKVFKNAKAKATINAAEKLPTSTPGIR
jgi:hypothetical protein